MGGLGGVGGGRAVQIDGTTSAAKTIDYAHNEIHGGSHFFLTGYKDLDGAGASVHISFAVPAGTKWPHTLWDIEVEAETTMILNEGVTINAAGTACSIYNNNRNSSTTSTITCQTNPSVASGTGATIYQSKRGAGNKIGGGARNDTEIIGKAAGTYLFRIIKDPANAHYVSWNFSWYEHTNR